MDSSSPTIVRNLRPPRHRGFAADLSLGFYLHARERMTYLGIDRAPDRFGWFEHRFVAFDGRAVNINLPRPVRVFLWPVGQGPRPQDCIAVRTSIWARLPSLPLNTLAPVELRHLYELWLSFNREERAVHGTRVKQFG